MTGREIHHMTDEDKERLAQGACERAEELRAR